jgi:hypothetical protein
MRSTVLHLSSLATIALLTACSTDATNPAGPRGLTPSTPSALIAPGEGTRIVLDSSDVAGNHIMVAEYPAGTRADGSTVASVTIRTFIPATQTSSGSCITNTIESIETIAGWSYTVKKSGGCGKDIAVSLENKSTSERAEFQFQYQFGRTRIDFGAVR